MLVINYDAAIPLVLDENEQLWSEPAYREWIAHREAEAERVVEELKFTAAAVADHLDDLKKASTQNGARVISLLRMMAEGRFNASSGVRKRIDGTIRNGKWAGTARKDWQPFADAAKAFDRWGHGSNEEKLEALRVVIPAVVPPQTEPYYYNQPKSDRGLAPRERISEEKMRKLIGGAYSDVDSVIEFLHAQGEIHLPFSTISVKLPPEDGDDS